MKAAPRPPDVLLVVPTLGQRVDYLRQALASIIEQPGCEVDLVVVAPSGTPADEIAWRAGARVVPDPQRGLSGAINAGIAAASPETEFFGWLGDDDLLRPGSLPSTIAALRANPKGVMAYGWCDYVNGEGSTFFASRAGSWAARIIGWGPNLVPQPGSLMRLPAVQHVGGLDENLSFAMDLDLFLKLRRHGELIPVGRTLAAFRWHDESLTVSQQQASLNESDAVRRRQMSSLPSFTWPVWRWPVRWSLGVAKAMVKRRASRSQGASVQR